MSPRLCWVICSSQSRLDIPLKDPKIWRVINEHRIQPEVTAAPAPDGVPACLARPLGQAWAPVPLWRARVRLSPAWVCLSAPWISSLLQPPSPVSHLWVSSGLTLHFMRWRCPSGRMAQCLPAPRPASLRRTGSRRVGAHSGLGFVPEGCCSRFDVQAGAGNLVRTTARPLCCLMACVFTAVAL